MSANYKAQPYDNFQKWANIQNLRIKTRQNREENIQDQEWQKQSFVAESLTEIYLKIVTDFFKNY